MLKNKTFAGVRPAPLINLKKDPTRHNFNSSEALQWTDSIVPSSRQTQDYPWYNQEDKQFQPNHSLVRFPLPSGLGTRGCIGIDVYQVWCYPCTLFTKCVRHPVTFKWQIIPSVLYSVKVIIKIRFQNYTSNDNPISFSYLLKICYNHDADFFKRPVKQFHYFYHRSSEFIKLRGEKKSRLLLEREYVGYSVTTNKALSKSKIVLYLICTLLILKPVYCSICCVIMGVGNVPFVTHHHTQSFYR